MKIVVLGAGISGLATAWFLKQKFGSRIELSILEKSQRVGGWIETRSEKGFLFEMGPRGFRPTGKGEATLELVRALGLAEQLLPSDPQARTRYLYVDGKLQPFSLSFLLRQGLLSAILHDLFTPKTEAEDETIDHFTKRRFNTRLAQHVMDPLAKGVFGGHSTTLSMRSSLPLLWHFEKNKSSVVAGLLTHRRKKAKAALYTLKGGMERLPQTLAQQLDVPIFFSQTVTSFEEIEADFIFSTLPVAGFAYTTLSLVHLGWEEAVLPKKGYGFLVPTCSRQDILGVTFDSQIFPQRYEKGQTALCVMLEGSDPQERLYQRARHSLKTLLNVDQEPTALCIKTAQSALPHYSLYHHERVKTYQNSLPKHVLACGTLFEGVGINDCITYAKQLVDGFSF